MSHTCSGSWLDSDKHKGAHKHHRLDSSSFPCSELIPYHRLQVWGWEMERRTQRHRNRKEGCMTVSRTGIAKTSLTSSRSHVSRLKAFHLLRERERAERNKVRDTRNANVSLMSFIFAYILYSQMISRRFHKMNSAVFILGVRMEIYCTYIHRYFHEPAYKSHKYVY